MDPSGVRTLYSLPSRTPGATEPYQGRGTLQGNSPTSGNDRKNEWASLFVLYAAAEREKLPAFRGGTSGHIRSLGAPEGRDIGGVVTGTGECGAPNDLRNTIPAFETPPQQARQRAAWTTDARSLPPGVSVATVGRGPKWSPGTRWFRRPAAPVPHPMGNSSPCREGCRRCSSSSKSRRYRVRRHSKSWSCSSGPR